MKGVTRKKFLITGLSGIPSLIPRCSSQYIIPDEISYQEDIEYNDDTLNRMDVYYSQELLSENKNPAVMMIHGGLWMKGDKQKQQYPYFASSLAQIGFIVSSINYRLAPKNKWPSMINDCENALNFLIDNSESLNINTDKIGLFGSSAGGHLSSLLYTQSNTRQKINCNVSLFGVYDMLDTFENQNYNLLVEPIKQIVFDNPSRETLIQASPIYNINGNSEEFGSNLCIHGTKDNMVDYYQAEKFNNELQSRGINSQLISFNGGHGNEEYFFEQWTNISNFLTEYLL